MKDHAKTVSMPMQCLCSHCIHASFVFLNFVLQFGEGSLAGYPDCNTIVIQFTFPICIEDDLSCGTNKLLSYLPNNAEGHEVLLVSVAIYL